MQWLHRAWRIIRWPLGILVVLYIGVAIFSIPHALEKMKTEEVVARIHSQKLTIENVNGEHLPPPPDPVQVDATVEGVDANQNGIRDDVELAIFEKYPNDAKIRAAELQYAMALQMEFTQVFNEETWMVSAQQEGRGFGCIYDNSETGTSATSRRIEVERLMLNTDLRKERSEQVGQYATSFKVLSGTDCDVLDQPK